MIGNQLTITPQQTMDDWRYSDERMKIRQEAFLKLKHYNDLDHVRFLYEFCQIWVSQGKKDTRGIEGRIKKMAEKRCDFRRRRQI